MKSIYKKDGSYAHGSLREQPEMKEPKPLAEGEMFHTLMHHYNVQLKNCRVIPCSVNNWKDGQELEDGKDYRLKIFSKCDCETPTISSYLVVCPHCHQQTKFHPIAVPIVETENELWNEVGAIFHGSLSYNGYPSFLTKLKSKFTIQRRKQ